MSDDENTSIEKTEASLLRELLYCDKERDIVRGDLIDFYRKNRRGNSAFCYIKEVVERYDKPEAKAAFYLFYGVEMELIEDYENAILCYSEMFSINPPSEKDRFWIENRYWMNNNTGYCLNKLSKYKEAEFYCLSAMAIKPRWYNAHKNLGVSFQGQGYYRMAAECYIMATRLCPIDHRALHHLEDLVTAHKGCFSDEDNIDGDVKSRHTGESRYPVKM